MSRQPSATAPPARQAPRVRLARDIDFSKAKPGCKHCAGRGIVGYQDVPTEDGKVETAAIVCRCVSRNKGVKSDAFDNMMGEMKKALESGGFAEALAGDIYRLPNDAREKALRQLDARADEVGVDERVRDACRKAAADVRARLKKESN